MYIDGFDSNEEWNGLSENVSKGPIQTSWNSHTISKESRTALFFSSMWTDFSERSLADRMVVSHGRKMGGSVEAKKDSDGSSSVDGEVHVTVNDDDGTSVSVSAEGSVSTGSDGNVSTEGGIKVSVEKEF